MNRVDVSWVFSSSNSFLSRPYHWRTPSLFYSTLQPRDQTPNKCDCIKEYFFCFIVSLNHKIWETGILWLPDECLSSAFHRQIESSRNREVIIELCRRTKCNSITQVVSTTTHSFSSLSTYLQSPRLLQLLLLLSRYDRWRRMLHRREIDTDDANLGCQSERRRRMSQINFRQNSNINYM